MLFQLDLIWQVMNPILLRIESAIRYTVSFICVNDEFLRKSMFFLHIYREDIAELADVLAWDAVGAQIEPYLVQHAEWQRPCGVALGCRSLNSRGIKCCGEQPSFYSIFAKLARR